MGCACKTVTKYVVTMQNGVKHIVKTKVERDALVARGGTYRVMTENG